MAETSRTRTRVPVHSGEGKIDKCTCFVRRLPQDIKEDELVELFGAVGPVKKAFVVQDKGKDDHKGYAFVTFALADDAKKAVQQLANHRLKGSKLKVRTLSPCCLSQLSRVTRAHTLRVFSMPST